LLISQINANAFVLLFQIDELVCLPVNDDEHMSSLCERRILWIFMAWTVARVASKRVIVSMYLRHQQDI